MQRPNPVKLGEILHAAAKLFAARPFHEVRLEDIATAAGVGKGTLYVYFESKEDLYIRLIRDGFARVVGRVKDGLANAPGPREKLGVIAAELVDFAFSYPDLFRVMRSGVLTPDDQELQRSRQELAEIVVAVLREGTTAGALKDPFPDLTAQFILSFVRGAALYPPRGLTKEALREHLLHVLMRGIGPGAAA
jgi:AcrR family transcriptional regulator